MPHDRTDREIVRELVRYLTRRYGWQMVMEEARRAMKEYK